MSATEAICWLVAYLAANSVIYLIWLRRRRVPPPEVCSHDAFDHTIAAPAWITVAELRDLLARCPDCAMVCISGGGPVAKFYSEPGANEPHVLLTTR